MMTADEALVIVETVLDYQNLNRVQEIIFRECWEGRLSYSEIAKIFGYQPDYIKDAAAKLWKLLSEAFEEKVTKKNLQPVMKRYIRRNQITLHRNQVIGVNLSCGTVGEANLSGAIRLANSGKADLQPKDLDEVTLDDNIELDEDVIDSEEGGDRQLDDNSDERVYYWNGLKFYSDAEVKIAEALDRLSLLFFPQPQLRLNTSEGRQNQQPSFVIVYQGKLGILQIDDEQCSQVESEAREVQSDFAFNSQDIRIVQHYDANRCRQESDRLVQEFLGILTQA